jgi:hypothetical protein
MDLDVKVRVYALELLTTQLISEYLRTVPDPAPQTKWARQHLHLLVDGMPVETESLDDEARLRVGIKEGLSNVRDMALARAQTPQTIREARACETDTCRKRDNLARVAFVTYAALLVGFG